MKKLVAIPLALLFALGLALAQRQTFIGKIGDSQCGLKHPIDDQKTPEKFAGQMVKVTGTLDRNTKTIKVESIEPAPENPCNPCAKKKP